MRSPALLAVACLALAGCGDDPTGPAGEATLEVSVTTTGGDPDLDGYQLQIDNSVGTTLDPTDEQTYVVRAGRHNLEFGEVAPNCTLSGDAHRSVALAAGETVRVQFSVTCLRTGITISSTALGIDLDGSGTQALVDGTAKGTVSANGTLVVSRLEPGEHTLQLQGIAPNCVLDGSPTRTLTVLNAELTPVAFSANCVSTYGVLRVQVTTTGERPDAGYTAEWSPDPNLAYSVVTQNMLSNDVAFESITGVRYVRLDGVAPNCSVAGGTLREVEAQVGTSVRDTAVARFEVSCVAGDATLRFTTTTTGSEAPPEFIANLYAGGCTDPYYCTPYDHQAVAVAPNGVTSLLVMSDTYTLYFNAGNTCRWEQGFSQTVSLAPGATVDVALEVFCERPLVRVTAPTTGSDADTQYTVILHQYDYYYGSYGVDLGPLAAGATLEYRLPWANLVWLELRDVAATCRVIAANPSASTLLDWGDVLEVEFPVTCGP